MKQIVKQKKFASNIRLVHNTETGERVYLSYGYYPIVGVRDGKIYINQERYSVSTSRQTSKVTHIENRNSGYSLEVIPVQTTSQMRELFPIANGYKMYETGYYRW